MKVLIIETQHCHSEIFPLWDKLFEDYQTVFWQSKKSSKLNIKGIFDPQSQADWIVTYQRPLSVKRHLARLDKLSPDLIVLNSAETHASSINAEQIAQRTKVPVIVLCHESSYFNSLSGSNANVFPLTLSELLSSPECTVHASEFHTQESLAQPKQLQIVVPGRVSPTRRYYPFLLEIAKFLKEGERITILGACSSKHKSIIKELRQQTNKVELKSSGLAFPEFIQTIKNCSALASLVEPKLANFSDYVLNRISGTLNLSIGLQKPLLGHEDYLSSIPHLNKDHYVSYNEHNLEEAVERLRKNSALYAEQLLIKKEELMQQSKRTIIETLKKIKV